ncbi:MAG TPA: nucleotide exchange factor GrpE [Patescibacteria group bacterium]|nr:nucleotide exchange factor GrpE [Patescibacteria group bacterium]
MKKKPSKVNKGERVNEELEHLKNQLTRALADYDNLRKRIEIEKEIWVKYSGERIISQLLPVLDMFEAALAHTQDQGLGIAVSEFKKVFYEEGLKEIKPDKGTDFDEAIHEAVESVEGGEDGKIAELVLTGWMYEDGRVVRYAKVKVFGKVQSGK